jgi:hypothetical protein
MAGSNRRCCAAEAGVWPVSPRSRVGWEGRLSGEWWAGHDGGAESVSAAGTAGRAGAHSGQWHAAQQASAPGFRSGDGLAGRQRKRPAAPRSIPVEPTVRRARPRCPVLVSAAHRRRAARLSPLSPLPTPPVAFSCLHHRVGHTDAEVRQTLGVLEGACVVTRRKVGGP